MKNFVLCLVAAAFAIAVGDHVGYETYWELAGSKRTVAWEAADPGASRYDWQVYSPVRKLVLATGSTQQTSVQIAIFSGHNVLMVSACNDKGCSEPAVSTNAADATVDGQPKGWWIFGVLDKPGPLGT
jgi:hypothetical protein